MPTITDAITHVPVLLEEAVSALDIEPSDRVIDGTYGRGGHARAMLNQLGPNGQLLVIDQDPIAIEHATKHFGDDARVTIRQANFCELVSIADALGWLGQVNGVLLDLGVSSPQLDTAERGFSFMQDGPLDMRMNNQAGHSAAQWLAEVDEQTLSAVIKEYGEERHAKRIAKAIINARQMKPIETTHQLASIVAQVVRGRPGHHPATRTFQAIRIYINQELASLQSLLDQLTEVLAPGGRMAVISFHSLEDRCVKQSWAKQAKPPSVSRRDPIAPKFRPTLKLVGKPIVASDVECALNPRARSARLRVAERFLGEAA